MIKVGYIDYFLDEWHANNYTGWLKEASDGEIEVAYCYGEIDNPKGGMTNKAWAEKNNITLCATPEEVVEKSDVLCILAPDNPETHERLSQAALKSGKITYIDKTFAPDYETARRIIELAEKHNTPMWSSSALRFASEYENIDKTDLLCAYSLGGGFADAYMIHQIEPLVMIFGADVKRVKNSGTVKHPIFIIEYNNGTRSSISCTDYGCPFVMNLNYKTKCKYLPINSDFFHIFIENLAKYFKDGEIVVPHEQTLAIMRIREALIKAKPLIDEWIDF